MNSSMYEQDLGKNSANFQPLTPLSFLERAAQVYPERLAVVHGKLRLTYAQLWSRSRKLASALAAQGLGRGDTVAVMLANTPAMIECHYGVPMCGAVLNAMNTRLDAATVAYILDHGEAKVLIADREFSPTIKEALAQAKVRPVVIDYDDLEFPQSGETLGTFDYEAFVAGGSDEYERRFPLDEWDAIALNYTSGTTARPKGVVYHHRGANLLAMGTAVAWKLGIHPVYLTIVPLFHCNDW
ncbi:MAG: AMP-binding protein, partial [Hyphomicrobiales bacterium]|nr:AMP-binding protein [Hyphomicrobiales bacterium]